MASAGVRSSPRHLHLAGAILRARLGWPISVAGTSPSRGVTEQIDLLIDTGASHSGVDHRVSGRLSLPTVGLATVHTPQGSMDAAIVMARIEFLDVAIPSLPDLQCAEVDIANQGIAIVLGRDFLRAYRFTYDGRSGELLFEW